MKLSASKQLEFAARVGFATRSLVVMSLLFAGNSAHADRIILRIATGASARRRLRGPDADLLPDRTQAPGGEERTEHTLNFIEGYSGSIVRTSETLEGVQNGIVDIGGFCYCFEPSNCRCTRSRSCCRSEPWTPQSA